jgi:hypothetical protein
VDKERKKEREILKRLRITVAQRNVTTSAHLLLTRGTISSTTSLPSETSRDNCNQLPKFWNHCGT